MISATLPPAPATLRLRSPGDGPWRWQSKPACRAIRRALGDTNKVALALGVYSALSEIASDAACERFTTTHRWIGEMSGLGLSTVKRALPVLVRLGLLRIEHQGTERPCSYELLTPPGVAEGAPPGPHHRADPFPPNQTPAAQPPARGLAPRRRPPAFSSTPSRPRAATTAPASPRSPSTAPPPASRKSREARGLEVDGDLRPLATARSARPADPLLSGKQKHKPKNQTVSPPPAMETVRQIHLPYCLKQLADGTWIILNRFYKPLGNPTTERVVYEQVPLRCRIATITPAQARQLSWEGVAGDGMIQLHSGGSGHLRTPAALRAYWKRVEILMRLPLVRLPEDEALLHPPSPDHPFRLLNIAACLSSSASAKRAEAAGG